jgi:hypothetical protein
MTGESGFDTLQGHTVFPAPQHTDQLKVHPFSNVMGTRDICTGIKQLGHEADHLSPSRLKTHGTSMSIGTTLSYKRSHYSTYMQHRTSLK